MVISYKTVFTILLIGHFFFAYMLLCDEKEELFPPVNVSVRMEFGALCGRRTHNEFAFRPQQHPICSTQSSFTEHSDNRRCVYSIQTHYSSVTVL
jgi:hypothetical protein